MEVTTSHIEDDAGIRRKRWTVDEYMRLAEVGILGEDDRVELIDGSIFQMSPQLSRHATALGLTANAVQKSIPRNCHARIQSPLALGEFSEPEPDICVVVGSIRDYRDAHPSTAELVIEIADASLRFDRTVKSALYARAGIPEYWIVNLVDEVVEVYSDPESEVFRSKQTLDGSSVLQSPTLPELKIPVADLLP